MSAVLEPEQTLRYSSLLSRTVCEERVPLNLCERPITPPTTPSASTGQLAEVALGDSLTELLSWRLKAPTHCPQTPAQDKDEKESVALLSAPAKPDSNTDSPSAAVVGVVGVAINSLSPAERLELESNTKYRIVGSGNGDIPQTGGASQHSAENNEGELVDNATAAPDEASAGSEVSGTVPDSVDGQGTPASPSTQSLSEAVITVDIASTTVYRRDKKLYVGKMRDLPCPPHVEGKWTGEIRPRLIKDLLPVLQILPRSMSSEETIIEPELCMSGYLMGKGTDVQLRPTVWIRCGGKKCRKAIRKAVDDLGYLHSFSQGPVEVRIRGPRPAASSIEISSAEELKCLVYGNRRLQVQNSASGTSACGLRLRVLPEAHEAGYENIFTIGGLIRVDNKIYGLTTAHGILDPQKVPENTSIISDPSDSATSAAFTTSDSESESEDESETSFGTGCLDGHSPPTTRNLEGYDSLGQTARAAFREQIQQLQWKDVSFCGPMSHCGRGSLTGVTNDAVSSLYDADFALIDMGFSSTYQFYNEYTHPCDLTLSKVSIRGIKHDDDLSAGEVFLLAGHNQVTVGHLLASPSVFVKRTVVFNTRKIQLDAPLPRGTSGTWVVRDNLLCGIIVAVYNCDLYAHMITADKMFNDIKNFQPSLFASRYVGIATEDDITKAYGKRVNDVASAPSESDSIYEPALIQEPMPLALMPHITRQDQLPTPGFFISDNRNSPNRSTRFDIIFSSNDRRHQEHWSENKYWITLTEILRVCWISLISLLSLIVYPLIMLYRGCKRMYRQWYLLRHIRYPRIFDYLIMTFALLFLVLSGTSIGLLVYQLIHIMGKDEFLLWELPFAVSILIFFSILIWLWGRLRASFMSKGHREFRVLSDDMVRNGYDPLDAAQVARFGSRYRYRPKERDDMVDWMDGSYLLKEDYLRGDFVPA